MCQDAQEGSLRARCCTHSNVQPGHRRRCGLVALGRHARPICFPGHSQGRRVELVLPPCPLKGRRRRPAAPVAVALGRRGRWAAAPAIRHQHLASGERKVAGAAHLHVARRRVVPASRRAHHVAHGRAASWRRPGGSSVAPVHSDSGVVVPAAQGTAAMSWRWSGLDRGAVAWQAGRLWLCCPPARRWGPKMPKDGGSTAGVRDVRDKPPLPFGAIQLGEP